MKKIFAAKYVVCLSNKKFQVSLEPHKIYRVLKDPDSAKVGLIRIIDESGEDYLYPANLFVAIEPPRTVRSSMEAAA